MYLKLFSLFLFLVFCNVVSAAETVRFKIKVDSAIMQSNQPLSGRLLIFMTNQTKPMEMIAPDFENPNAVWITAK